jgi:hypothetical protein
VYNKYFKGPFSSKYTNSYTTSVPVSPGEQLSRKIKRTPVHVLKRILGQVWEHDEEWTGSFGSRDAQTYHGSSYSTRLTSRRISRAQEGCVVTWSIYQSEIWPIFIRYEWCFLISFRAPICHEIKLMITLNTGQWIAHLLEDVDSALRSLHLVDAGSATDVSEVHSASILRVWGECSLHAGFSLGEAWCRAQDKRTVFFEDHGVQ